MSNWRKRVLRALDGLGGAATLDDIYARVQADSSHPLPVSWQSIVRRTLGDYCKSSQHYGGTHFFDQVSAGYWRLSDLGRLEAALGDASTNPGMEDDGLDFDDEKSSFALPEAFSEPFDPLAIKISRRIVTIDQVVKRIGFNEIELAPDFQRRARIWDIGRKSKLIESIMLRIPLPVFYVASDTDENWRVVDGLQRLTTIYDFVNVDSDYTFPLRGLEYLSDYEDVRYSDLPRGIIRRIGETELNINVIESGTPDQVMFNIFKRLNTGGMSLNSQEIRHALNPGLARTFLLRLADSDAFQKAVDHSVRDHRMGARELALRFVAFFRNSYTTYAEGDLEGFLNDAMKQINKMSPSEAKEVESRFYMSMTRAFEIFGRDAFRKRYLVNEPRNRVNRALFEAWSVALARLSDADAATIIGRREEILKRFSEELRDDLDFDESVSVGTGSKSKVSKRFQTVEKIIEETIKHD